MAGTVGAAQKAAVRFQNTPYFAAYLWDILAVEEHMVGNNQIQAVLFEGKPVAVKGLKRKTGVLCSGELELMQISSRHL